MGSTGCIATREAILDLLKLFPCNVDIRQELIDDALCVVAAEGDEAFLTLLLRWGAQPMGRDCLALRKAVVAGHDACVRAIVQAAGVSGLKNEMPCCVMRAAVQRGHLEVREGPS